MSSTFPETMSQDFIVRASQLPLSCFPACLADLHADVLGVVGADRLALQIRWRELLGTGINGTNTALALSVLERERVQYQLVDKPSLDHLDNALAAGCGVLLLLPVPGQGIGHVVRYLGRQVDMMRAALRCVDIEMVRLFDPERPGPVLVNEYETARSLAERLSAGAALFIRFPTRQN